jgi:nucleoside-diphosphate-sugar epimerase
LAQDSDSIEIWGDGKQTRSFLYVDECLKGMQKLMHSNYQEPINIGSDRMVTINQLAKIAIKISGKNICLKHIPGVQGVRGRNSDNKLIKRVLNWVPSNDLERGMTKTYRWILSEIKKKHGSQNF